MGADQRLVSTALHGVVPKERRVVTPELALVDPALAATERARLPEPDDTLSRLSWTRPLPHTTVPKEIHAGHPMTAKANGSASQLARAGPSSASPVGTWRFRRPTKTILRTAALVLSVGVALVLAGEFRGPDFGPPRATLVDSPLQKDGPPESGDTGPPATAGAGRPKKRTQPSSQRPAKTPRRPAAARRFAWAPIAGSAGYRVEFFRGSQRVFAASTPRAEIEVPARWRYGGGVRRLTPGQYRWYVWPIVGGKRASTAIVQAKLVVP